ncbi:enoyl-CoA hydratase-related protein [uncultured Corynebacterium sp.]|uniref:enoyl-CoA hydratase-related protein n=1 Tax=uncultured Corynebacterium sp. TaxID=159447 RepID=UPI0025D0B976|nr:enoyl-CoA hydratase-related protein [uncultured Corynebacterium sp.]
MSDSPVVLVEQRGYTLLVTINRPEVRNAVNRDVALGLGEALELAERTPEVRTVVVTGAGDRAFCAGADLRAAAAGELGTTKEPLKSWGFGGFVRHWISKPVIAAVNGFALGGGTEIALASDLVVAAETATFGLPEVTRGIMAAAGGAFRLPRQIPLKAAMETMLTAEPIAARRAFELGMVNRVVPAGEVLSAALDLAARINRNAPLSVQATKRVARGIIDGAVTAEAADWDANNREAAALMTTADAMEGMSAFAQNRSPEWKAQ